MPRDIFRRAIIARTVQAVVVEGDHHSPPEAVDERFLSPSTTTTWGPGKDTAAFADLVVADATAPDAVCPHDDASRKVRTICGDVAFGLSVAVGV